MKRVIAAALSVSMLACFAGCVEQSGKQENSKSTKPSSAPAVVTTINSTTGTTTVPTAVPTTQTTTKPTAFYHTSPGKDDSDLTFTPADVPDVYWNALNNRQVIYYPYGCFGKEYHSGSCYAWLDDHRFPYLRNEIATSDGVWYAVVDMDGDGKQEVLIRDNDTLLLREKDGCVYAYNFGFRAMDYVYTDGTFTWNDNAGSNYGVSKLKFNDDNTYAWVELYEINHADEFGEYYDEPKYFVEGQEVTHDEYLEYSQSLCRTKVEFKELTRYPVREKEEIYPGG